MTNETSNDPGIPHYATLRGALRDDGIEEFHIECRFNDGQKFAGAIVNGDCYELAQLILRAIEQHNAPVEPKCDHPQIACIGGTQCTTCKQIWVSDTGPPQTFGELPVADPREPRRDLPCKQGGAHYWASTGIYDTAGETLKCVKCGATKKRSAENRGAE